MGKSHKKVKNDRINAIRKQYDAFLEEDKKRKERNEYILGQLDKMRSSIALVPISNKANYHMELNTSEIYMRPSSLGTKAELRDTYVSRLGRQNVNTGLFNTPVEELGILKEISKKYILIPKRTKSIENEINYSKDLNDVDWKTKYNILDDLKKLEKEGQSDLVYNRYNNDDNVPNKRLDLNVDSYTQPVNLGIHPNNFDTPEKDNELPIIKKLKNDSQMEQDKVCKQVNFNVTEEIGDDNKNHLHVASGATEKTIKDDQILQTRNVMQEHGKNSQQDVTEKEKYDTESNEKDMNSMDISSNNPQINQMSNINHPVVHQENFNVPDCNESTAVTNEYLAPENIKEDIAQAAISNQTVTEVKSQEPSTLTETAHLDQNIENQKDPNVIGDFKRTETVALYDDVDPQGLVAANETTFEKSHDHDPTQTNNPAENIQPLEHTENASEIDAFEAEQREMFYKEHGSPDAYSYIQSQNTSEEYPEGYGRNDQYAYYENVQEQAYKTNINEHEESTERYDPHYNEQFEASYKNQQAENAGYDNTNVYQQEQSQPENPQLENVVNYENQQENAQLYQQENAEMYQQDNAEVYQQENVQLYQKENAEMYQQENAQLYQQENVSNVNLVQENVVPQDEQTYGQNLYVEQLGTPEDIEQQLIVEEGYIESSSVGKNEVQNETEEQIENVLESVAPEDSSTNPTASA